MSTSQNGWNAGPKTEITIVSPTVPGTNVDFPQGVLKGDVETVLMYVAEQFHKTVEPLKDGWCWGYYYKNIEGSTTLSNHASGTAIDLNAPEHPMGVANTFSTSQVAAIRKILAFLEGTVRWGGDYSSRKDDMHFEINRGADEVARVAAKIRALNGAPAPAPTPKPTLPVYRLGSRVLSKGMTGTDVKEMQTWLIKRGRNVAADGDFGPITEGAVKDFQQARWLDRDGIVGPDTLAALLTNFGVRVLKEGMEGADVKEAQRLLRTKGYGLVLDGVFGPATKSAVKSFQRRNRLWPDGIVGPKTAAKLRA